MKLYDCIVDDGQIIFRTYAAAQNKKDLLNVYSGNGAFEKIEDVTDKYLDETSSEKLISDLTMCGWGKGEREMIRALVDEHIRKRGRK